MARPLRRLMVLLAAFLLMNASVALAEYPVTLSQNLSYQVRANTTVSILSGMQVAQITFDCPDGEFGTVFLSTMQIHAQDMRFFVGKQELVVSKISFYPAFSSNPGKVIIYSTVTDTSGGQVQPWDGTIAQWNN